MKNLFGENQDLFVPLGTPNRKKIIKDNRRKELSSLFKDNKKDYSVVKQKDRVVVRSYNSRKDTVCYMVYTPESFKKAQENYKKNA